MYYASNKLQLVQRFQANYDHMLKAQQASGQTSETTISEETKFLIFQEVRNLGL